MLEELFKGNFPNLSDLEDIMHKIRNGKIAKDDIKVYLVNGKEVLITEIANVSAHDLKRALGFKIKDYVISVYDHNGLYKFYKVLEVLQKYFS